jgi:antitoxin CcdA
MSNIQTTRKPTNLSLDQSIVQQAKELGVNLSQAAEQGLRSALAEQWKQKNKSALQSSNAWVEENGLPLIRYRQF